MTASVRAAGTAAPAGPARLDVSGVVVDFGGVRAVDGADLSAEPGAIVGLIGPNGSGKTTLLDVISGLVTPAAGSVRLDGESLVEYLPEERSSLGVVRSFQDCRLFPELSVEDVLMLTLDARRPVGVVSSTLQLPWARRAERAKRTEVDGVIASFGIDRFRRHRIAQLSTGTRRVVDLASMVLARPRLLLLDEPTAGIAQREAEAFVPLLRRLHQLADTTIVLVEHDVPLVFALCTKVVMMETGSGGVVGHAGRGPARSPRPGRLPRGQRGGAGRVRCRPRRVRPMPRRRGVRPVRFEATTTHPRGRGSRPDAGPAQRRGMAGPKGTSPRRVTRWAMRVASP